MITESSDEERFAKRWKQVKELKEKRTTGDALTNRRFTESLADKVV